MHESSDWPTHIPSVYNATLSGQLIWGHCVFSWQIFYALCCPSKGICSQIAWIHNACEGLWSTGLHLKVKSHCPSIWGIMTYTIYTIVYSCVTLIRTTVAYNSNSKNTERDRAHGMLCIEINSISEQIEWSKKKPRKLHKLIKVRMFSLRLWDGCLQDFFARTKPNIYRESVGGGGQNV